MHVLHEASSQGHNFHLEAEGAQSQVMPIPMKGVRATCSCGFVAEHLMSMAETFKTIKEHIGEEPPQ